ncbi:MAG: hypothetical protein O9346_08950 [Leptospiraceae bacterium]|nr:hypothetical protein [Leptospiraceae bacterium]MCZ8346530.1 hypothetical protein [Leptospiraceae bacterium]
MIFLIRICFLISLFLGLFYCNVIDQLTGKKDRDKENENNLILLALVASSAGCDVGRSGFWTVDFITGEDFCLPVTKVAEGSTFTIFEETGLGRRRSRFDIPDPNYSFIISEIENKMLSNLRPALGNPSDVNRDGKVDIIVRDMSSFFSGSYVAGYFNPIDLFNLPGNLDFKSNRREVIYIDGLALASSANLSIKRSKPNDILSVIAHEYQHLVRYQHEILRPGLSSLIELPRSQSELDLLLNTDSLWINEGTSELSSDIAGFGPQESRLTCLRGDPGFNCGNIVNGKSLYQFRNRILDYSISYAWMRFVYENSATTVAGRNDFILKTIQGTGGRRANNISNLIDIYKLSNKYNATDLGTTNVDVFGNLTLAFFGGFFKYPTSASKRIGLGGSISANGLLTNFTMPTELMAELNLPSSIQLVSNNPTTFDLEAGQMYRVSGAVPALTANTNVHLLNNGTAEYVIINGSMTENENGFTQAKSLNISENSQDPRFVFQKPIWNPPKTEKLAPYHASEYIIQRNMWNVRNWMLRN